MAIQWHGCSSKHYVQEEKTVGNIDQQRLVN